MKDIRFRGGQDGEPLAQAVVQVVSVEHSLDIDSEDRRPREKFKVTVLLYSPRTSPSTMREVSPIQVATLLASVPSATPLFFTR